MLILKIAIVKTTAEIHWLVVRPSQRELNSAPCEAREPANGQNNKNLLR